jgi:hypothetical protein
VPALGVSCLSKDRPRLMYLVYLSPFFRSLVGKSLVYDGHDFVQLLAEISSEASTMAAATMLTSCVSLVQSLASMLQTRPMDRHSLLPAPGGWISWIGTTPAAA